MFEWMSIVISSLILEDPTTILVSTRVHDGQISWLLGGSALFFGILLGDVGLYVIGYLTRIGFIKREVTGYQQAVSGWSIFAVRFAPGLRVIVYTSTGFLKYPFIPFFVINSLSCVIWSVLLISLGQQVYKFTGWWGVGGIVGVFVLWQLRKKILNKRKANASLNDLKKQAE